MGAPPNIPDHGCEIDITHLIDTGVPGTWANALLHSPCLNVSDYLAGDLPDPDGVSPPLVTVPRREAADRSSCSLAHPARVSSFLPLHSQSDSPEAR